MGIKGLIPYIKRKHPELIKQIPKRWLSPELKGRTVAIDGPLLTSRFFFAAGGQELEDKRMVIGWHALITTMRKAGVKPITVWDVKGERPWKMKEHARRELTRQLHMSRVLHEDQRKARLEKVRIILEAMSEVQQEAMRRSMSADDALRGLSKEVENLIQEVQSSSRPSKGNRRRPLIAEDESQTEAELESEGEAFVEDRPANTATPTSKGEDVSYISVDESNGSNFIGSQNIQQAQTDPGTPGNQIQRTTVLDTPKFKEDVQSSGKEVNIQSDAKDKDENAREASSRKTVINPESPAFTSETTEITGAGAHIIEDKDIRRLLKTQDQRHAETESIDTISRQNSLPAADSGTEVETAVTEDIRSGASPDASTAKTDAARVLEAEEAARQTNRLAVDSTVAEDGLVEIPTKIEAETSVSAVSSPESDVGEDTRIDAASREEFESREKEQVEGAALGIDDLAATINGNEAQITSLENITDDDIVDDVEIKRALVEPAKEYTESPRQMALTSEEDLRLQDIDQAMRSNTYDQSQITEFSREFDDLAERARLVSRTYERGHRIPTKWELEECQELMHVMGVPVVLAHPPFEAEGLASAMALAGIADFVGTEDSDVLGYEAPLLRNVATTSKPMEIVEGHVLRSIFNLSPQQFIDFLVLMGTDASSRIPGVGPVKAMKLIQEHSTIEGILDHNEKLRALVGPDYLQEIDAAREVFTVLPPLPRPEDLEIPHADESAILDFLRQGHGIDLSTDLRIPYEMEDVEIAFEAYQKQSSCVVE
ncbi:hypothetical protein QFC22_000403 [Naganishia vaughanmartiniae]|uniref:Uncharacterized protein n=1 Tax=Naganishia vaughanmartiniae TaxID=1424756 RepID=A0ACC2XQ93_9TREE|nr:hypothetical protein QFC22_000403 [Naganishia vaughanmartiniae]